MSTLIVDLLEANFWDYISAILSTVPKLFYFLVTCVTSFLDLLQVLFRKFAGLDVFYDANGVAQEGDIVSEFVRNIMFSTNGNYSPLQAVFWALIIFGVLLLFLSTIICIIKSQYFPDDKAQKIPAILTSAVKAAFNIIVVPVAVVFGLSLINVVLRTVDSITQNSDGLSVLNVADSNAFVQNDKGTYYNYDIFGVSIPSSVSPLSSMVFKSSAFTSNRCRNSDRYFTTVISTPYSGSATPTSPFDVSLTQEETALLIDYAFAYNIPLEESYQGRLVWGIANADSAVNIPSVDIFSFLAYSKVKSFSKYNVSLVYYYYDLWGFNYLLAIVFLFIIGKLLISVTFGVIKRMFVLLALFLSAGPIAGVSPLATNSFNFWKKLFIEQAIGIISAVAGMNFLFLLLPYFSAITYFNPNVIGNGLLNQITGTIIACAAVVAVDNIIEMLNKMVTGNEKATSIADEGAKLGSATGSAMGSGVKTLGNMGKALSSAGTAAAALIPGDSKFARGARIAAEGAAAFATGGASLIMGKGLSHVAGNMINSAQEKKAGTQAHKSKENQNYINSNYGASAEAASASTDSFALANSQIDSLYSDYTASNPTSAMTREQFVENNAQAQEYERLGNMVSSTTAGSAERNNINEQIGKMAYAQNHKKEIDNDYRTRYGKDVENLKSRQDYRRRVGSNLTNIVGGITSPISTVVANSPLDAFLRGVNGEKK